MKQSALIFIALWLAIQLPLRAGHAPAEAEDAASQSKSDVTAETAAKTGDFHTPEQDKAGMTRAAPVDIPPKQAMGITRRRAAPGWPHRWCRKSRPH